MKCFHFNYLFCKATCSLGVALHAYLPMLRRKWVVASPVIVFFIRRRRSGYPSKLRSPGLGVSSLQMPTEVKHVIQWRQLGFCFVSLLFTRFYLALALKDQQDILSQFWSRRSSFRGWPQPFRIWNRFHRGKRSQRDWRISRVVYTRSRPIK